MDGKLELYNYQKQAVRALVDKEHCRICTLQPGSGKSAVMLRWLKERSEQTGANRVLIVTTASKARTDDFQQEAKVWCGEDWITSLCTFEVVSWHKLRRWLDAQPENVLAETLVAFDEVARVKGYSTGMAKAALKLADKCVDWSGYTGTPGDRWIDLMTYFVMGGMVKNKTKFQYDYCVMQTYKGFPEVAGYRNTKLLEKFWDMMSVRPSTRAVFAELPEEIHRTVYFDCPAEYKRIRKTRVGKNGEMLETAGAMTAALRQACFSKEKQEWISDFVSGLGTNAVLFCNFIEEENELEKIIKKALPKGAKVWRIDGTHHDIPTAETIGKYDIVVAHYASGSEALNLQFMHYWVSVSPNYSYSVSVQARGRIKRLGQKNTMFYYYLWCKDTIEDKVYKALKSKSDFSEKTWAEQELSDLAVSDEDEEPPGEQVSDQLEDVEKSS